MEPQDAGLVVAAPDRSEEAGLSRFGRGGVGFRAAGATAAGGTGEGYALAVGRGRPCKRGEGKPTAAVDVFKHSSE